MLLQLDTTQRTFLIIREGFSTRTFFCNLHHIPEILTKELERNDSYKISEFFNYKFRRCSKKFLNEMFIANQINFKIK